MSTITIQNNQSEVVDIDMVVSVGTGIIPVRPLEPLNFASFVSLTGLLDFNINSKYYYYLIIVFQQELPI